MAIARLRFKANCRVEEDVWRRDEGLDITSPANLRKIADVLEHRGSIVIEHWIYRGGQAPRRRVFDEFDELVAYLVENAHAGDILDVWSLHDLISDENRLVTGKCPDEGGCVPKGGAY